MWSYLDLLGLNFECEVLIGIIGVPLTYIQLDGAGYLIGVAELESFDDAIRDFGGYKCSKVEYLLLYEEDIGVDHGGNVIGLTVDNHLLLKDGLKVI